jgi:hypothetical protein
MRAMILDCMERTVECDWRNRTGAGIRGETNPHPKHALERRQYPLCGREILSVYPPTDYTRQQRSAYGDTPTARLPIKCGRLPGELEAARGQSGKEEATPPHLHAARQCVRACATSDAGTNLRPGSRLGPRLGVASQTLPDGRTAQARIPAATCAGWPCAAHARPTSDAEQSLHTGIDPRHRCLESEQNTNKLQCPGAPGRKFRIREVDFLGLKNGRLPAGGPSSALRREAKGVA